MMNHWIEIPGLKGDVGCTSLVTHIAKNLDLLEDASVTYINILHWLIDYDYFNHAHMLKKGQDRKLVMMMYAVDSLVFDLQRKEEAPHMSAFVRITRNP